MGEKVDDFLVVGNVDGREVAVTVTVTVTTGSEDVDSVGGIEALLEMLPKV